MSTGVLWTGDGEPVSGANDALQFIRSKVYAIHTESGASHTCHTQGKKVCFVSNNSSKSRAEYLQRFHKLGMTAHEVLWLFFC